jgi:hypothetical protein
VPALPGQPVGERHGLALVDGRAECVVQAGPVLLVRARDPAGEGIVPGAEADEVHEAIVHVAEDAVVEADDADGQRLGQDAQRPGRRDGEGLAGGEPVFAAGRATDQQPARGAGGRGAGEHQGGDRPSGQPPSGRIRAGVRTGPQGPLPAEDVDRGAGRQLDGRVPGPDECPLVAVPDGRQLHGQPAPSPGHGGPLVGRGGLDGPADEGPAAPLQAVGDRRCLVDGQVDVDEQRRLVAGPSRET